jgi:hypothetical protein
VNAILLNDIKYLYLFDFYGKSVGRKKKGKDRGRKRFQIGQTGPVQTPMGRRWPRPPGLDSLACS